MTVCIAVLCDNRKAIVLVADKMIGLGTAIETQPEIKKILRLHKQWWIMFSGNDVSPVFDIVDHAKQELKKTGAKTVDDVINAMVGNYEKKRWAETEALYLAPRGWTSKEFKSTRFRIPSDPLIREIDAKINDHELSIDLLIAGFDARDRGQIFSLSGYGLDRGIPRRHDVPGFHSIGTGSDGALYMMQYRKVSSAMPVRQALYYAMEAKYFGELAPGVGERTDLYIIRPNKSRISIREKTIEDILVKKLCESLEPGLLKKRHVEILNSLAELAGLPQLEPASVTKQEAVLKVKKKRLIV